METANLEFRRLPDWRVEELMEEMDEIKRKRLVTELERRMGAGENIFYAEIPKEGAPGESVGVGSWRIRSWPRIEGTRESAGLVEISFVHVRPAYRGMGIGLAIVEEAIRQAGEHFEKEGYGLRKVYALLSSGNDKGIEAYRNWGFIEEAVMSRHFSDEFDTIMMTRFL
ncbi:MAG: GNAT family N-acetyltransferase [Thermoplasmatota archaeon]